MSDVTPPPPLPLSVLCILARGGGRSIMVSPEQAPAPSALLAGGFLPYLDGPARLETHLDVCAGVAACVRVLRVGLPADGPARAVAHALLPHLESVLAESA